MVSFLSTLSFPQSHLNSYVIQNKVGKMEVDWHKKGVLVGKIHKIDEEALPIS